MKLGLKGQFPPFFPNQGKQVKMDNDSTQLALVEDDVIKLSDSIERKEVGGLMDGLDDLRTHVEQLNDGFQLNQGELATIRQDIFEINDTIKNLLAVFEAMTPVANTQIESSDPEPSIGDVDVESIEDVVPTILEPEAPAELEIREPEALPDQEMVQKTSMKVSVTVPRPKDVLEDAQASREHDDSDPSRHYSVFQAQKMLEFEVDKLFVMRLKDTPIEIQDLERFDRCVEEFRRHLQ